MRGHILYPNAAKSRTGNNSPGILDYAVQSLVVANINITLIVYASLDIFSVNNGIY